MEECEIKRKVEFIKAAITDYKKGILNEFQVVVAVGILFTDHTPSPEAIKWAEREIVLNRLLTAEVNNVGGKWQDYPESHHVD